jgi:hypothetical protein
MSEADVPERVAVNFIKDEPSDTDFFGSHSRVAGAVAEVICEDNGINVVGLLGRWGSGKSTVVSQIQKLLIARREDIHFFNYDAWLYQNDPPRRAFLEALIEDLVQNTLSDKFHWQHRLADLSGRSEETVTETSRSLSSTGKWLIGSLGLVPIGTVFLGRALDPKNIADAPWMMWVGSGLTLAPVIIAGLFYLSWRPWRQSWFWAMFSYDFLTRHREPYAKQSIFALLTNQSVERSERKTKISPEPSVMEFRNVFRDVLKSLRVKRERLIIVIDNLDRLAETDAIELWATIRSLFLGSELSSAQKSELTVPTIILPIDEGAVQRMFHSSGNSGEELARSFMDKTFDVSFYINDPVMSDWRAFFKEKLKQALGSAATDERVYWATKFIEDHATLSSPSKNITPRLLVKLVNTVGVLVKQWGGDSIDVLSMVFFALHRSKISEDPRAFVQGDWPNAEAAIDDWQRDVVALHYGVPRAKAYQALLQEPLRLAISTFDEAEFTRLSEVIGFGPVFEEVVANPPPTAATISGPQANFIANAALLVASSDVRDELWAIRGMKKLASTWSACGQLDKFRSDFAEIVRALSPHSKEHNFLQVTASQLGTSLAKAEMSVAIAKGFVEALNAIRDAAKLSNLQAPLVQLTLDDQALFVLLKEVPATLRPMLCSDKTAAELISALNIGLSSEKESAGVAQATRALASNITIQFSDKTKPNWDGIAGTALNIIANNNIAFHATGPAIDVLGVLYSKNANTKTYVQQLFDQGHLANRLNEADQANNSNISADVTALMLLRGSDFVAPNGKNWETLASPELDFVTNFINAMTWYAWSNIATYAHQSLKSCPSLRPIVRELIKNDIVDGNAAGLTTDHLFKNINGLIGLVGTKLVDIALVQAAVRPDFWTTLEGLKEGQPYDDAVRALSNINAVDRQKLIGAVKMRLAGYDAGTWTEAFIENVVPYGLAQIYGDTLGQSEALGAGLKVALTDALAQTPQWDAGKCERWFFLIQFISKDARAILLKNLRDKIQSGAEFIDLADVLIAGKSRVLIEGKFEEFADKTTRHLTIPLLLTENGLLYVAQNIDIFTRCLIASDNETKNAVRETMASTEAHLVDDRRVNFDEVQLAFSGALADEKTANRTNTSDEVSA